MTLGLEWAKKLRASGVLPEDPGSILNINTLMASHKHL